jgi:hypothetical protein
MALPPLKDPLNVPVEDRAEDAPLPLPLPTWSAPALGPLGLLEVSGSPDMDFTWPGAGSSGLSSDNAHRRHTHTEQGTNSHMRACTQADARPLHSHSRTLAHIYEGREEESTQDQQDHTGQPYAPATHMVSLTAFRRSCTWNNCCLMDVTSTICTSAELKSEISMHRLTDPWMTTYRPSAES